MTAKERLRKALKGVPLDDIQQAAAEEGIDLMSEEEAAEKADVLERSLDRLPTVLVGLERELSAYEREVDKQLGKNDKPRS